MTKQEYADEIDRQMNWAINGCNEPGYQPDLIEAITSLADLMKKFILEGATEPAAEVRS